MSKKNKKKSRQKLSRLSQSQTEIIKAVSNQVQSIKETPLSLINEQERYLKRQIRRKVVNDFSQLKLSGSVPTLEGVRGLLVKYLDHIPLVREALQPEKSSMNPWANEIWRLLELDEEKIKAELAIPSPKFR